MRRRRRRRRRSWRWPSIDTIAAKIITKRFRKQNRTPPHTLRLLNALNSEDRGLKARFSLATIAFDRESAQMSQILSSQGKNAPSNPYPQYLVRLATSR